jgi:quercetin dioxygenase-like cupin family protein
MEMFEGTRESRRGSADWFSGVVWLDPVIAGAVPSTLKVTRVSFEPGARTAWHTHPRGQGIFVLSGICQAQAYGVPLREVRAGDAVWFAPGEVHWHGAKPGHTMVHLAMQEADEKGVDVVWMEQVTDEEIVG